MHHRNLCNAKIKVNTQNIHNSSLYCKAPFNFWFEASICKCYSANSILLTKIKNLTRPTNINVVALLLKDNREK